MNCSLANDRRISGAIRLLDVAAIVCVVTVLAFLLILGMGRFKEHSLQTRCQNNLRQIATALQLYAKDFKDLLPDCTPANPRYAGPIWPWDMNTNLTSDLAKFGITRDALYCPANPEMNDDRHWNYWRVGGTATRMTSYPILFRGVAQLPRNLWRDRFLSGQSGAQTELGFDATAAIDGDYRKIQGAYTDRSSHIRGNRPLGGNILFLDQHVAWRDFSDMHNTFNTLGTTGRIEWRF